MISARKLRRESEQTAKTLGYVVASDLPTVDISRLRPQRDIEDRTLVLFCVASVAHGSNALRAMEWLQAESLLTASSKDERTFLEGDTSKLVLFRAQEEALWALCWALGLVPDLDFAQYCAPTLSTLFPRIAEGEGAQVFREKCALRPLAVVLRKLDLAYCLSWAIRQASIERSDMPGKVRPYVILERRRALEWMTGEDEWGDISLDT